MEQADPQSGPLSGLLVAAHPLTFSRTPPRYHLPPPRLDEHGTQIRAWLASRPAESR
jgi:crotonobetainyl-CoA:carnitine CoA-transferase CaiB-like acyl-CoA transferase